MSNCDALRTLIEDVLLLEPGEFSWELKRDEVDTWDSLAVVSIAVGLDETFGHHPAPDEATSLTSIPRIVDWLLAKGVLLDE